MTSKIINRQTSNIIASYLYDRPYLPSSPPPNNHSHNILKPLDHFLRLYFSTHKHLGSSQRHSISEKVYSLIRYEYLLSHLIRTKPYDPQKPPRWSQHLEKELTHKIDMLFTSSFYQAIDNPTLPKYTQTHSGSSEPLKTNCNTHHTQSLQITQSQSHERTVHFQSIHHHRQTHSMYAQTHADQLGNEEAAYQLSSVMNTRAPLTIRVNCLKTTKHQLIQKLQQQIKYRLMACEYAPFGFKIVAPKNVNLMQTEEFKQGHFQIQDQGSQLAALMAKCRPGDLVLDYCGGSGGKSLALAHLLQGKGQIFLHEPRESALLKAKRRFSRAGVQNVQFHNNEQSLSKIALGKMHWVMVDAPCTGTGTLRRNPDIKLKFNAEWLKTNVLLQREIVTRAIKYMHREGRLLYITCSLLRQQNEEQIKYFSEMHNLQLAQGEVMKIPPQKDGSDGFFAAVLKRKV